MLYFKEKMHQIRFRLGLRPKPHWGSLKLSTHNTPTYSFKGAQATTKGREGGTRQGKAKVWGKGRERTYSKVRRGLAPQT